MYKINIYFKYLTICKLDFAYARDNDRLKAAGGLLVLPFLHLVITCQARVQKEDWGSGITLEHLKAMDFNGQVLHQM